MRVPLKIPCPKCGREGTIFINLDDASFDERCVCGKVMSGSLGLDVTVGCRLLRRSEYELKETQDYPLSMVLSATAFECELSRLHLKCIEIDALERGSEFSDQELDKELRKHSTILQKINQVSKLLDPRGFDGFAKCSPGIRKIIEEGFRSVRLQSVFKDFQEKLFWPRNKILHRGVTRYGEDDARRSFKIAALGLHILHKMEKSKFNL